MNKWIKSDYLNAFGILCGMLAWISGTITLVFFLEYLFHYFTPIILLYFKINYIIWILMLIITFILMKLSKKYYIKGD